MLSEISKNSNIQIILTTHNYSTIANAPDGSLFSVEAGDIAKKDKDTIIYEITDGDLDLTSINSKKYNLFVEGKTDKQIIENAIKSLDYSTKFKDLAIINCQGGKKVKYYINELATDKNKLYIALYDCDTAGLEEYNKAPLNSDAVYQKMHLKVNNDSEQKHFTKNKTLSIEYMFHQSKLKKYLPKDIEDITINSLAKTFPNSCVCFAYKFQCDKNKTNFANETTNFDTEDFKNFENIFKEIENYIQEFNTNNSNI
jgi:ribosomal protein L23